MRSRSIAPLHPDQLTNLAFFCQAHFIVAKSVPLAMQPRKPLDVGMGRRRTTSINATV